LSLSRFNISPVSLVDRGPPTIDFFFDGWSFIPSPAFHSYTASWSVHPRDEFPSNQTIFSTNPPDKGLVFVLYVFFITCTPFIFPPGKNPPPWTDFILSVAIPPRRLFVLLPTFMKDVDHISWILSPWCLDGPATFFSSRSPLLYFTQ